MIEPSPDTAAVANSPWWESTPVGANVLLAFVKLDRAGSTREWQELPEAEVLRRRAQYISGVEYIANKLGAAWPLQWQGDGVMLFFKGDEQRSAVTRAFEAASAIRERVIVDLAMQVRIAAHAAVIPWNPETGKLAHPALDLCGHLEHAAPINGVAVTEDVYLTLSEDVRQRFAPLGVTVRDGLPAYVFPGSMAGRKNPEAFRPGEDVRLWEDFRRYVSTPEIRRLRYVGFPLQKKQPPSLDIREVFIAPKARVRANQGSNWSRTAQLLPANINLSSGLREGGTSLKPVEAPLPPELISELVGKHRSLVVLGDPGAGKTTVLKWLAVLAAGGPLAWAEQLGTPERLLPLMVSVGRLAEIRSRLGAVCSVTDALAVYFHDRNVGEEEGLRGFLERTLEAGECLVLLDGLDEVRSEARVSILGWLETFCGRFPRNRFVVSARLVGYSGFTLPEGVEVEFGPFNDEQIRRYARAFERACRRWENNGVPDDMGATRDAEKLLKALFDSPRLRALAKNPFLLSALALIHRAEGRLPRHRVQAYEIFARTLCETWGIARRVVAGEANTRDIRYEEEAIPILGELALRMHREWPTGVAPEDFVIRTLADAIRTRDAVAPPEAERSAKEFLERAGKDVQILLERGTGQWGFLHLTFQEFFTAVGLLSSERFKSVAFQHLFDPRWEEVLRLGVGYMALIQKRAQATQDFIRDVLDYEAQGSQQFLSGILQRQIYLAALLASEAGDVLPPPLQEEIARAVVGWNRFMPNSVVKPLLQELASTEFAERLLDALLLELKSKNTQARTKAIFALGTVGGDRAERALIGATKDPSKAIRLALCEALPNLETIASRDALSTLAGDPEALVRVAALRGMFYKGSATINEQILRIISDQNSNAFISLLSVLASFLIIEKLADTPRREAIDPELVKQVIQKGIQHENPKGRREAGFLLELHESKLPDDILDSSGVDLDEPRHLFGLLFWRGPIPEEALDSPNEIVRSVAISKLARARNERAASALIEESKRGAIATRIAAISTMGRIQDRRFEPVLLKAFKSPQPTIRAEALSALERIHAPEAERLLIRSLRDPEHKVRMSALEGLESLESSAAIGPLVQHIKKTSNPDEKREAISVLWKLSTKVAVENPGPRSSKAPRKKAPGRKTSARKR